MSSQSQESFRPTDSSTAPPSSDGPGPSTTSDTTSSNKPVNTRLLALEAKKATLEQTISDLKERRLQLATQAKLPSGLPLPTTNPSGEALSEDELLASALKSSSSVVKGHIALLHKYNEIKDIGQGLMGLIADRRDCRVVKVMEEFGIGEAD